MKRAAVVFAMASLWVLVSAMMLALWTLRFQAFQRCSLQARLVEPARDLEAARSAIELETLGHLVVSRPAWTSQECLHFLRQLGRFEPRVEKQEALGWEPGAVTARFRLVRLLLEIEQSYAASQSLYPLDPALVDRPEDPFAAGALLRYEPALDGLGYRVWSRGPDGSDDGGTPGADLVFERKSATTRSALSASTR